MSNGQTSGPVIGIDLGGTHLQVGVVDEHGEILADHRAMTHAEEGPTAVVDRMASAVTETCAKRGLQATDLVAVGVVAPGAIDMPRGIVLTAPNLGWTSFPLRAELESRLPCPVVVDNDVNGAAWGEYTLGAGRDGQGLLAVWVGTGVGGGLVMDDRIVHGPQHTAGEIGQMVIRPREPVGHRTVEDMCSRTGMSQIIRDRLLQHPGSPLRSVADEGSGPIPSAALGDAVSAGCPLAGEVVGEAADLLGVTIANIVTLLSLDVVVIGGGVTEVLGPPFVERIRDKFAEEVFPGELQSCAVRMTELTNNAGLLGAALLARETGAVSPTA